MAHSNIKLTVVFAGLLAAAGCQHVTCGDGTYAVHGDGSGYYIDQDGRGYYVDQDGGRINEVVCAAVTPPTVCGVGTVQVVSPPHYLINPDGRGYYIDQDGRGYYVDQDDTIPAGRACVLGELHRVIP